MFCGSFEKFHGTSEVEKNYAWNYLQCLEKREIHIKARLSALPGACHISGVNIRSSSSSSSSQSKQSISAWTRSWRDVEKFTCRPFLRWNSIHTLLLLRGGDGRTGGWLGVLSDDNIQFCLVALFLGNNLLAGVKTEYFTTYLTTATTTTGPGRGILRSMIFVSST